MAKGLTIERVFTKSVKDPYSLFEYERRESIIKNPDGSIVFHAKNIEVPSHWSQLATDVLAQKYLRKSGVPQYDEKGEPLLNEKGEPVLGAETSVKQIVHRLAGCWRHWGETRGYFATKEDAQNFYDELVYMLLNQMAAPNSPQWFNTGLAWAYGITGKPQGHSFVNPETGEVEQSKDAYTRSQVHACFIQSLKDDLVNPGGIFDLLLREARVFKYGGGSGTNFSSLRGKEEPLSGGGSSSGLMSFLKVFDAGAGAIKSGGTTRRAAKMICLDIDHPEIEDFIMLKYREEQKVVDLVTGSKVARERLQRVAEAARQGGTNWRQNKELRAAIRNARRLGVPLNYVFRVLQLVEQGITDVDFTLFDTHYESGAYETVTGQNANNSVRITNEFLKAVKEDREWHLRRRTDGSVHRTVKARELWEKICFAAWHSADPGVQYDTTINEWHTCPAAGPIRASNPCSEYMFLDDTACNLASLNVGKFLNGEHFDVRGFKHATRLMTIVLEISVLLAHFPSEAMARNSYNFRTLGLGYANIGSTLMRLGIPYDSEEARGYIGAITGLMHAEACRTSAELAASLGPFKEYERNKEAMLRVIRNHRRAAYKAKPEEYEGLTITPQGLNPEHVPDYLLQAVRKTFDEALALGEKEGFRNAQLTLLAPTGTISLIMDCDTTGIEPDFAIVKFKKLAGGGYFKIINQSVPPALKRLGYREEEIEAITKHVLGHATLKGAPAINHESLRKKGFTNEMIAKVEENLKRTFDISFVFNRFTLGDEALEKLGFKEEEYEREEFRLLEALGFTKEEIEQANDYVCGTMSLEGAPFLKEEHLPVFDCASRCGKKGKRFLPVEAHIRAMAAAQPFLSGAISKTINMPAEATIKDVGEAYLLSWKMMLKANALYRDGSKLSQPLNTVVEDLTVFEEEDIDEAATTPERVQQGISARLGAPTHEGVSRSALIAGRPIAVLTAEYEDGSLGSVELAMEEESEEYRGLLKAYSDLLSLSVQEGVPLQTLVERLAFADFPPGGPLQGDPAIKNATSPVDYLYRVLGHEYLGRQDLVHEKGASPTRRRGSRKRLPAEQVAVAEARARGYTGDKCPGCGSLRLKRNGTCAICEDCGATTGCS